MPRFVFLVIYIILTLIPFPFLWIGQMLSGAKQPASATQNRGYYGTRHHNYYPGGGWFIFSGNAGRGGWLESSTRRFNAPSTFNNRSYKGGSSSFGGGSFGSFGK